MKTPEIFATDLIMLKEMLLGINHRKKEVEKFVKRFLIAADYRELGKIRGYFLEKVVDLKFGSELRIIEKSMRRISILIAKQEKKINLGEWENKYDHATEDVRIEDVVKHYLNPRDGVRRRIRCPFHDGKSNHLQVYEKTNSYHCFSCKASGTPINFVMGIEKCDFKEAVDILQNF